MPKDKTKTFRHGRTSPDLKAENPLAPSATLAVKLGSLVVHYQELASASYGPGADFDRAAIRTLEDDREVKDWLAKMHEASLLPVKR